MNSYQILKNGEPAGVVGTLDYIIKAIRNLEENRVAAAWHDQEIRITFSAQRGEVDQRAIEVGLVEQETAGQLLALHIDHVVLVDDPNLTGGEEIELNTEEPVTEETISPEVMD